ncbi:MAG: Ig-like domain-containing protein [Peptococcia bacterium]
MFRKKLCPPRPIAVDDVIVVTVTAEDGETEGQYKVTVVPVLVTGVSLNKETVTLAVGEEETLTATVSPAEASNQNVSWESSETDVATVDDNGVITAVGVGTATITVTTEDGNKTDTCGVTVNPAPIDDFTYTGDDGTSATFMWTAADGATSIKIEQSGYNSAYETWTEWTTAYTAPIEAAANTATVVGLTAGERYKFKLLVTGGNNAGDSNEADVTMSIDDKAASYGASWTSGADTNMTRLGGAEGKTAGAHFNDFAPWSGMERRTIDGQVMVELPKFYYKHTYADGVHEFWVADGPAEGFKLHPAFIRTGVEKEYIYMGAYKASLGRNQADTADALASVSGALPAVSKNITQFRTLAEARGQGWTLADALTRNAVALLYLVEYADTDSQNTTVGIGKGITELRYTADDKVTDIVLEDEIQNNDKLIVSYANTGRYYDVGQIIDVGTELGKRDIWKNRMITEVETVDDNTTITVTGGEKPGTAEENHILYHVGQKTGGCDELDGVSGSATKYSDGETPGIDGKVSVSYRGLEDLWGNVWEFVDGINIKNRFADNIEEIERQPYVADHGFVSNKFSEPYKASGIILPSGKGYVRDFACSGDADWLLMPSAAGGTGTSSSTYIPDYFYQNWNGSTSDKVALVGGRWRDGGSPAGLFDWDVAHTSYNAHLYVGARALLIP